MRYSVIDGCGKIDTGGEMLAIDCEKIKNFKEEEKCYEKDKCRSGRRG